MEDTGPSRAAQMGRNNGYTIVLLFTDASLYFRSHFREYLSYKAWHPFAHIVSKALITN